MRVELNHTTVPVFDREASARFYRDVLGFEYTGVVGRFAQVRIASQRLVFDFYDAEDFASHHYAFKVSEAAFDEIFAKVEAREIGYGSGPRSSEDGRINDWHGGRGIYFRDPNGHLLEILTSDGSEEAGRR